MPQPSRLSHSFAAPLCQPGTRFLARAHVALPFGGCHLRDTCTLCTFRCIVRPGGGPTASHGEVFFAGAVELPESSRSRGRGTLTHGTLTAHALLLCVHTQALARVPLRAAPARRFWAACRPPSVPQADRCEPVPALAGHVAHPLLLHAEGRPSSLPHPVLPRRRLDDFDPDEYAQKFIIENEDGIYSYTSKRLRPLGTRCPPWPRVPPRVPEPQSLLDRSWVLCERPGRRIYVTLRVPQRRQQQQGRVGGLGRARPPARALCSHATRFCASRRTGRYP